MARIKVNQTPEAPLPQSEARERFQKIIDAYKKQNPVKFERKRAELETKLAKL